MNYGRVPDEHLSWQLIRVWLATPHDAYPMVGEFKVDTGNFYLGHMAAHTLTAGHRTGVGGVLRGGLHSMARMAVQAVRIIARHIANQRLVRVVAVQASNTVLPVAKTRTSF